jgi:hypothetical protein
MRLLTHRVPGSPVEKDGALGEFGVYNMKRLGLAYNTGAAVAKKFTNTIDLMFDELSKLGS